MNGSGRSARRCFLMKVVDEFLDVRRIVGGLGPRRIRTRIGNGNKNMNKRPPQDRLGPPANHFNLSPAANEHFHMIQTSPVELSGFAYMFIVSFVTLMRAQNLED